MTAPFRIFVSCALGLEPMLMREVSALGGLSPQLERGGVRCRGHREVVARLNLESGLASHVLVRVGRFEARRFDALERELSRLPLERFLSPGVPRTFRVRALKSKLIHTGAIAERAARVLTARLGDAADASSDVEAVPVHLRLVRDRVEVSVDTSGAPLHRRGYRLEPGPAPLREDLARALVIASGWDGSSTLIDPLCGVGTIPIEAGLLAAGIAPGRHRAFALWSTPLHHAPTWDRLIEASDARSAPELRVRGADRSATAIAAAGRNAERAGVPMELEVSSLGDLDLVRGEPIGALVTDPPHGRRLRAQRLERLHRALARTAHALPDAWSVAIYSADRALEGRMAPRARLAFVTDAGGLRLRALSSVAISEGASESDAD